MIALSIIFVGAHALSQSKEGRDWRLLFAFCFGFVHGFGFANVLREMRLPRGELGWSLFSFNVGVEIGQACIVLAVAPLLAQRDRALAHRDRQDDKFEAAYVAAMVKGHTEALEMIDNKLLKTADNDAVKTADNDAVKSTSTKRAAPWRNISRQAKSCKRA